MKKLARCIFCMVLAVCRVGIGQQDATSERAPLPRFTPDETEAYFFSDVFSRLVGPRPNRSGVAGGFGPSAPGEARGAERLPGGFVWSEVISATTLEDEIKALKQLLDSNVRSPADFAGPGHRLAWRDFTILAMLFEIVSEYDGEVRFRHSAAGARQAFATTAAQAAQGRTEGVYRETERRKQELGDLLRGSRLDFPADSPAGEAQTPLGRLPLMERLETALDARLLPSTADPGALSSRAPTVLHEAEMIAAIAEVLTRPGMMDADDPDYSGFALRMKQAALEVREAVRGDRLRQALQATAALPAVCGDCHELYR